MSSWFSIRFQVLEKAYTAPVGLFPCLESVTHWNYGGYQMSCTKTPYPHHRNYTHRGCGACQFSQFDRISININNHNLDPYYNRPKKPHDDPPVAVLTTRPTPRSPYASLFQPLATDISDQLPCIRDFSDFEAGGSAGLVARIEDQLPRRLYDWSSVYVTQTSSIRGCS